jgi:hypothetical protein
MLNQTACQAQRLRCPSVISLIHDLKSPGRGGDFVPLSAQRGDGSDFRHGKNRKLGGYVKCRGSVDLRRIIVR